MRSWSVARRLANKISERSTEPAVWLEIPMWNKMDFLLSRATPTDPSPNPSYRVGLNLARAQPPSGFLMSRSKNCQAEDSSLLGAYRAALLGSPHPGPPPRPRFVLRRFQGQCARPGHGRARTPQLPLSRQRTRCCQCCRLRLAQRRLKSLCVFCIMLLVKSPLGGTKN